MAMCNSCRRADDDPRQTPEFVEPEDDAYPAGDAPAVAPMGLCRVCKTKWRLVVSDATRPPIWNRVLED
jgi:hypothetical protein